MHVSNSTILATLCQVHNLEKVRVKIGEIPAKATDFTPEDIEVQTGEKEPEPAFA